ncbi:MAG: ATP-binding protein [Flavobacteriales bacterium]|nr:ATP-binding protein [Flavobacteriales bacterium]
MKTSPFIFGNTVSDSSFTDRDRDSKLLKSNLLAGINTMVISPRRWGKSSLVEKVFKDIDGLEGSHSTVMIDVFSLSTEHEFLETFASEIIKASSTRMEDWVRGGKDFFKNLIPKISFGVDPSSDFSLSFDYEEIKKHSNEILNLPETIAKSKGLKFVIAIDEFQDVALYDQWEVFEKKMRSIWQKQKHVTYCLYGSKRHMMSEIFNKPSNPFFRFGDIIMLNKISKKKWVDFILEKFDESGKRIDESLAEKIPRIMKNHSWYVQQLSHYVWLNTNRKTNVDDFNKALDHLIQTNKPLYQRDIEYFSKTQVYLLKAVSMGEYKLTSTSVMNKYKLGTPRNVFKNKVTLIERDIIQDEGSRFEFLDPAFELWFRKQFFKINYEINKK